MLSDVARNVVEAGSIRINQMVYDKRRLGIDVTVLSLGEAFFDIPQFDFSKLDFVKGYHYSDTRGLPQLRERIANFYATHYQAPFDPSKNLVISAGSKILLYMTSLAILNPGDEALVPEPYWVSYPEQIKLCRGVPKAVPYWAKARDFENYFTDRTKLVILNNPNNPAGSVYTEEDLRIIHDLCLKRGAYLVVDEAYSDFCIRNEFYSAVRLRKDLKNIIVVNSLSKNMGMSGWRIGYIIANEETIFPLLKLNQHLITCAPTILLQYCENYFDQILAATLPQVRDVVLKRDRIAKYMDSIGLKYLAGASTFYFFVDISKSQKTSLEFAEWLLEEHQIAVVPGSAYGESTDHFVRVGVGTESEEAICNALMVIRSCWGESLTESAATSTGVASKEIMSEV